VLLNVSKRRVSKYSLEFGIQSLSVSAVV